MAKSIYYRLKGKYDKLSFMKRDKFCVVAPVCVSGKIKAKLYKIGGDTDIIFVI